MSKIGIIGAMDLEVEALKAIAAQKEARAIEAVTSELV